MIGRRKKYAPEVEAELRYYAMRRLRRICIALGVCAVLGWGGSWVIENGRRPIDPLYPANSLSPYYGPTPDSLSGTTNVGLAEEKKKRRQVYALMNEALERSLSDAEGAYQLLDEAVRLMPNEALPRGARAEMLIALARYEAAYADSREAMKLSPDEIEYRYSAAIALAFMGDMPAAVHEMDVVVEKTPENQLARLVRANLSLAMGDVPHARIDLDHSAVVPADGMATIIDQLQSVDSLLCRGSLMVLQNKDAAGLRDLERAGRIDPANPQPYLAAFIAEQHLNPDSKPTLKTWLGGEVEPVWRDLLNVYGRGASPDLPLQRIPDRPYADRQLDITVAHYYLAEWFAASGDAAKAQDHFNATLKEGAPYTCEYGLAKLRLAALRAGEGAATP